MSIYDILLAFDLTQSIQAKLCIGMQQGEGGGEKKMSSEVESQQDSVVHTNIEILILILKTKCIYPLL